MEALVAGATFVARSFAGDKKQLVPLLKAALNHKGLALLDVVSPCVTFNDFASSTKSWEWAKDHEEPLHEVGFVPKKEEIVIEQKPGETTTVQLHDGSWIVLRALKHEDHDVSDRGSALKLLSEGQTRGEFMTGLIYLDTKRPSFVDVMKMSDQPLSSLPDAALRPPRSALEQIMATV